MREEGVRVKGWRGRGRGRSSVHKIRKREKVERVPLRSGTEGCNAAFGRIWYASSSRGRTYSPSRDLDAWQCNGYHAIAVGRTMYVL